jgi:hypothetical protein
MARGTLKVGRIVPILFGAFRASFLLAWLSWLFWLFFYMAWLFHLVGVEKKNIKSWMLFNTMSCDQLPNED